MRTFVAVEIVDHEVLAAIKKIQDRLRLRAKPADIQNMHFTLLFLGEVNDEMASKIQVALEKIEFESFEVRFEGIGAFPKPKFPRVVWVGTDRQGGEKLSALAKQVQDALVPLGFSVDKPFRPHITIFRIKNKIGDISDNLARYNVGSFGSQTVSEIKFKKSVLTPQGPIYSDLQGFKAK